jgi:predicted nucleotidyltransferase
MSKASDRNRNGRVARGYWGADVPLRAIRRFARQVGERFCPERVILFGSHAYGTPHADSDVDLMVVMPARNRHDLAVKIRLAVPSPFPMDLLVRTPTEVRLGLAEGDTFLTEVVTRGRVLHEAGDRRPTRPLFGGGDSDRMTTCDPPCKMSKSGSGRLRRTLQS